MVQRKIWRSRAGLVGLAVGFCLTVSEASAKEGDGVRYRRPTKKVQAETNLQTKVEAEKKRSARDEPKTPRLDGAALARQRVAVEQEIAQVQIKKLEQLIKLTTATASDYPDLLFRLADLQLSLKAYHEMQAGELEQSIFEAKERGDKTLAATLRAKQNRHRKSARTRSQRAVRAYDVLLDAPSAAAYKRRDEALYYAGFEHGLLGNDAQMRDAYVSLIQDFPTSSFTPNALVAFGDQRFAAGKVTEAARLYARIIEAYPDSPMFAYAHYKIAWCQLNPGDDGEPKYARSLQSFVAAISATLEGRAGSEENGRLLRRDARRDLVRAYVHAGRPSAAWSFFRRVGTGPKGEPPMARKMMELLAGAYFGEGKYVESSAVYQTLIAEFSDDAMTCEWQYRVVVNAVATDDADIVWKETDRLADRWSAAKDGGWAKSDKKRCRDHTSATLRQMATVWHDEADKTGRDETYARSEQAYERYLEAFGDRKAAYGISYFYGEVLWQQAERMVGRTSKDEQAQGRAKFREARDAFVKVLERNPKGKHAKEAAYAQMLAMKNYLEYDELAAGSIACRVQSDGTCPQVTRRRGRPVQKEHVRTPLGDDEVAMMEAYDLYAKYVRAKKDPELPKILYHRVRILVDHNHFDEALPLLQTLVEDFDGTRSAAWGAAMLLDVLTIEWSERATEPDDRIAAGKQLQRWAAKIEKLEVYSTPEAKRLREQVPKLLAAVGWVEAEQLREKGAASGDDEHFVACGRKYLDLFNDYPDHDRADALLFNAARCLEAGHLVGNAIKARRRLLEDYPESQFAKQTLKEVGQNYQRVAFYGSAAEHFEQYAARYSKDEFASEALQNAFLFRLGLGDDAAATENLRKYEQLYRRKDPARAAGIYWAQHDLLEDEVAQARHAQGYISNYGKKGGVDRLVVAHAAAGKALWRKSCSKGLVAESCITIRRKRAQAGDGPRDKAKELRRRGVPNRCGSEKQAVIVVHPRDAKLAAKAQAHFAAAIKLSKKVGAVPDDARRTAFEDASAMALVFAADKQYEEYLQILMPTDLDFGHEHEWKKDSGVPRLERQYAAAMKRRAATEARLAVFFESKDRVGSQLLAAYGAVPKTKSKYWTLAAAARSAVLNQNFADQFYRAPVPKSIKNESMYDAYCDAISLRAELPQKRAKQAFTYCLERSTEFQYFNEFSRMCEDEMQQRDADAYPATNELFGNSEYTQSRLDRVGVQTSTASVGSASAAPKKSSGSPR